MHIPYNLSQQMGWLVGNENEPHPWGSRSIFPNDMGCGQC